MKKKSFIIAIGMVVALVIVIVIAYVNGFFYKPSEQQKRYMTEINASNAVVYYYGDLDPGSEIDIEYKKISEFTDETIGDLDKEYDYHAIVVLDFDGKMNLTNDELLLIKDYCEKKYYDLLYYGTENMDQFRECGYFQQIDSSQYGFVYNGSYWLNRNGREQYINPYLLLGNWSEQDNQDFGTSDKHMMWKMVISMIVGLIRDSVGEL